MGVGGFHFDMLSVYAPAFWGGGHFDMVTVFVPDFWMLFCKIWNSNLWVSSEVKKPKLYILDRVYFEQIMVKNTLFEQNWMLFF